MSEVLYEQDGPVVTITINRPDVMNAVDPATARQLHDAVVRFRDDSSAAALILTGSGERAFSAGGDLKAMTRHERFTPETRGEPYRAYIDAGTGPLGFTRITDVYKPTIAAVNGYCFAGGLEMACWCDLRIAAEHAEFGVLNRRYSVPLVDGGTQRLWRIVGLGHAMELVLLGKRIDAQEARRIGLVNEVAPAGRLLARCRELAGQLASFPQEGLRADKQATVYGLGRPLDEGLRWEAVLGLSVMGTEDNRQGPERFVTGER